jgi:hypothetical protein
VAFLPTGGRRRSAQSRLVNLQKRKALASAIPLFMALVLFAAACGSDQQATREPSPPATDVPGADPEHEVTSIEGQPDTRPAPTATYTSVAKSGAWKRIEPQGETRCAHDTPFAFWARKGTTNKALVYFQGGGGCWDAETCGPGSNYYDASVDAADDPARMGGILDTGDPRNSFSEYSMIYIPSCTGDVHWGDIVRDYPRENEEPLSIYHRGFVNGQAALEWLYANVPDPETILVTGCSAGSVGSIVHAPYVIEHYPGAAVSQMGDSLAFVFHRPVNVQEGYNARANFPSWIEEMALIPADGLLMGDYYAAVANHYPERRFSQFNTRADQVQQFYFAAVGGQPQEFSGTLLQTLEDIGRQAPNFYSYTADGTTHCITPRPQFYSLTTDGVPFVSWLEQLVEGEPLASIACPTCEPDA